MIDKIPTLTRHEAYGVEEFDPGKALIVRYTLFTIGFAAVCFVVTWVCGG